MRVSFLMNFFEYKISSTMRARIEMSPVRLSWAAARDVLRCVIYLDSAPLQRNQGWQKNHMDITHIIKTPGVCGGKACIKGHRVRVMDIVVWHEMRNYSAEEIIAMFPGITLADVYAALTYYLDNRQEIEADFAENDALAQELMKEYPSKLPGKRSA